LGLWIRIQNLDPSRKAKITQKNEKEPKKELPNELKASLGYLRLLLKLRNLLWRLKKKTLQFEFEKLNFMSTLIWSSKTSGSGVSKRTTGSGSVFNQYNSESLKVS
jgi:hypothetical protein